MKKNLLVVILLLFMLSIVPVVADSGWDNSYGGSSSSSGSSSSHSSSSSHNYGSSRNGVANSFFSEKGISGVSYGDLYAVTFYVSINLIIVLVLIRNKIKINMSIIYKIIKSIIPSIILTPLLISPFLLFMPYGIFIILIDILTLLFLFFLFYFITTYFEEKNFNKLVKKITKKLYKSENKDSKKRIRMLIKAYNDNDDLLEKLKNIFIDVQLAWMNFDYEKLKKICSSELYTSYKSDLEVLYSQDGQNVMEDFKPIRYKIAYVKEDKNKIFVTFILNIRFKDYVINTKDSSIIKGNNWYIYDNFYELEFMINKNPLDKCPNCGADVDGNECRYCDTIFTNNNTDYVLLNKKLIDRNL